MNENRNKISKSICIHFDIDDHQIPIETFVTTANSIEIISKELNKKLFNNKLNSNLFIKTPSDGGFIEWLNCVITNHPVEVTTFTYLLNFTSYKITNKPITNWINKILDCCVDKTLEICQKEYELSKSKGEKFLLDSKIALKLYYFAIISFLFENNEVLSNKNITPNDFPKSFKAKNEFFESCITSGNGIKGIGFRSKHDFPIKRNMFHQYITKIDNKKDEVIYLTQRIKITNPTIDGSKTMWTGKLIGSNKTIKFSLDDEYFNKLLSNGLCPIKGTNHDDEMLINFAYRYTYNEKGDKTLHISAQRVHYFNDKEIFPLAEGQKIDLPVKEKDYNQLELFRE